MVRPKPVQKAEIVRSSNEFTMYGLLYAYFESGRVLQSDSSKSNPMRLQSINATVRDFVVAYSAWTLVS